MELWITEKESFVSKIYLYVKLNSPLGDINIKLFLYVDNIRSRNCIMNIVKSKLTNICKKCL